jgi:hypothetical protein
MLKYFSPSSYSLYLENQELFYQKYIVGNADREPQMPVMACGSALDAYAKAYLYKELKCGDDPQYELRTIFEAQVEEHLRDNAWKIGAHLFDCYRNSGALADLLIELGGSMTTPRFEFSISGKVGNEVGMVPLSGKPDIFYVNKEGAHVLHDWKVNGYMSKASPAPGYIRCRPGMNTHKLCMPVRRAGIMINGSMRLEQVKEDWARQLAIYGWLLGEEVGFEFISSIDQFACNSQKGPIVDVRVAAHRNVIGSEFQKKLLSDLQTAWEIVNSDHFFRNMSKEDSAMRCEALKATWKPESEQDHWLKGVFK